MSKQYTKPEFEKLSILVAEQILSASPDGELGGEVEGNGDWDNDQD